MVSREKLVEISDQNQMNFNFIDKDQGGDIDGKELTDAITELHSYAPEFRKRHIRTSLERYITREFRQAWDLGTSHSYELFV